MGKPKLLTQEEWDKDWEEFKSDPELYAAKLINSYQKANDLDELYDVVDAANVIRMITTEIRLTDE